MFVVVLAAGAGCAHRPPMMQARPTASACHQVVPDRAVPVGWAAPDDARDLERIGEWCRTVGPVLVESPQAAPATAVDELAILTWNVHVGGGDVAEVVKRLKRGDFTDGTPVNHFLLLLQEAHREGSDVPAQIAAGAPVPRPIVEQPPNGMRLDIRSAARSAGLHVFYAPAMRNSRPGAPEDRGVAILSTLPLADLQVVELPFERQRRVAIAATVNGHTSSGERWQLRVADVQVDTSLALTRGGPFVARRRQAEALVEALTTLAPESPDASPAAPAPPMILGGDFNTWLGDKEPALEVLRRAFPDTPRQRQVSTWRGPLLAHAALDHVFVRGTRQSVMTRRLSDRFGSDHYPLLTLVSLV